ncbi:MAG: DUF5333 domain-containing protein [Rhodobacterales bacterium]|jgi:hypothetical protein|nr:DUF5333 domain-containing protein [Rhodobacterales bacterium]MDX5389471.1 DUF5333 domain-containing protein [Rhodobacterales bacterium]MDX5489168.1 DUF5333 domain-containing protein [Rhodobacterales bacterium]
MQVTRFGFKTLTAGAVALVLALPAMAAGKPNLRDLPEIDDSMLWVALAIEISDRCPTIEPRTMRGLTYLWSIRSRAQALGYTPSEIKAYVDSDAEKARMRARGEAYVRDQGLNPTKDADLCKLGQAEIAKGSQIGAFLRLK